MAQHIPSSAPGSSTPKTGLQQLPETFCYLSSSLLEPRGRNQGCGDLAGCPLGNMPVTRTLPCSRHASVPSGLLCMPSSKVVPGVIF